MANMCQNTIVFYGSAENLEKLRIHLIALSKTETPSTMIEVRKEADRYIQALSIGEIEDGNHFEAEFYTKWNTTPEDYKPWGEDFGLNYVHHFEESGSDLLGTAYYFLAEKELVVCELEEIDYIESDEEGDESVTDPVTGIVYECKDEANDLIAQERFKAVAERFEKAVGIEKELA